MQQKLKCDQCGLEFQRSFGQFNHSNKRGDQHNFCSTVCIGLFQRKKQNVSCKQCDKGFVKKMSEIRKSLNNFCSKSCSAKYRNAHKITGNRRSKLEIFLESKLRENYPKLELICNDRTAINSELDFYFPGLKLAFELNGIFHYEPIYGAEKLSNIKTNDDRKMQACWEKDIELCIVDSSSFKHFKEGRAMKYLEIFNVVLEKNILSHGKHLA